MLTTTFRRIGIVIMMSLALGACAVSGVEPPGATEVRQAVIEQITPADLASTHATGLGAVVGGLAGLGIGSLVGRGNGRDVARVVGALGGALIGNEVQERYDHPASAQHVIVRTKSGVLVSVVQPTNPNLYLGLAVFLEGSGQSARVVPEY